MGTASGAGGRDPEPEGWGPQEAPPRQVRPRAASPGPSLLPAPQDAGGGRGHHPGKEGPSPVHSMLQPPAPRRHGGWHPGQGSWSAHCTPGSPRRPVALPTPTCTGVPRNNNGHLHLGWALLPLRRRRARWGGGRPSQQAGTCQKSSRRAPTTVLRAHRGHPPGAAAPEGREAGPSRRAPHSRRPQQGLSTHASATRSHTVSVLNTCVYIYIYILSELCQLLNIKLTTSLYINFTVTVCRRQ